MSVCIYACMDVCLYVCMSVCSYVCKMCVKCMYHVRTVYMSKVLCMYIYVCMYVCMYLRTYVCICMYGCLFACMYVSFIRMLGACRTEAEDNFTARGGQLGSGRSVAPCFSLATLSLSSVLMGADERFFALGCFQAWACHCSDCGLVPVLLVCSVRVTFSPFGVW